MSKRKIIYIAITVICLTAILVAAYTQFFTNVGDTGNIFSGIEETLKEEEQNEEKDVEKIKSEFNNLFTNTFFKGDYDTSTIAKIKEDEDIVYSAYSIQKAEEMYEININLPVINIKTQVANSFNLTTQQLFANKANDIIGKTDSTVKTVYSVDYVAVINGNILSLIIRSNLKEGDSSQRVIIQTYNYNIVTEKEVTIQEMIAFAEIEEENVKAEIRSVVEEASREAETLKAMGYPIYTRDINSEIYKIENTNTYFLGQNKELYIIYAYGNQNFTSEIDIVVFD